MGVVGFFFQSFPISYNIYTLLVIYLCLSSLHSMFLSHFLRTWIFSLLYWIFGSPLIVQYIIDWDVLKENTPTNFVKWATALAASLCALSLMIQADFSTKDDPSKLIQWKERWLRWSHFLLVYQPMVTRLCFKHSLRDQKRAFAIWECQLYCCRAV